MYVVVADGPTAQHLRSRDVVIAGQLSTSEHYALAFQAHNPLVSCVNRALSTRPTERWAGCSGSTWGAH